MFRGAGVCRALGVTWRTGGTLRRCFRGAQSLVSTCASRSEDSFKQYFSEMPWLAVPYTDEARRSRLNRLYGIQGRRSWLPGVPGDLLIWPHHLFGFSCRGERTALFPYMFMSLTVSEMTCREFCSM